MGSVFIPRGIGKENVSTAKQYQSKSQIEIHTPSATYGPGQHLDPSKNLLSWTFGKQLSSDNAQNEVGTVTLTLTAGVTGFGPTSTWMDLVHVNDLLIVYASPYLNSKMRTRFIGVISDVSYATDTSSDPESPTRSIQIQAEDLMIGLQSEILFPVYPLTYINGSNTALQNLFSNLETVVSAFGNSISQNGLPLLNLFGAIMQNNTSQSTFAAMSPSQIASQVVSQLAPVLYSPTFYIRNKSYGGSANWLKLISLAFGNTNNFSGANYYVTPQEVTLQNMLSSIMNPPFLEFFGDVRSSDQLSGIPKASSNGVKFGSDNAEFYMVVRNTPFDTSSGLQGTSKSGFEQLPITDVYLKDVSQQQFSFTNEDVVNYYFTYPESFMQMSAFQTAATLLFGAIIDVESVTKYGLHPMQVSVMGFPNFDTLLTSTSANDSMLNTLKQFNQTLYDWYHLNPEYLRGTITVHGDPSIRVGQRIRVKSLGLVAYVEAIQEQYVNMQSYTAQVTFSRGVFEKGYPGP